MNILEKFNNYFISDNDVDLSKRKVIKTAGALAALTIIGAVTPRLLKAATLTIQDQINSGLIENQTFYLTKTIYIDIPNVMIRNCKFIAKAKMENMIELGSNANSTLIQHSHFAPAMMAKCCIKVNPKSNIRGY
jgi:hypothetical protein